MNPKYFAQITAGVLISFLSFTGCALKKDEADAKASQAQIGTGNPADQQGVTGVMGMNGPTSKAVVGRIQNAVSSMAVPSAGNFQRAVTALGPNLPENTNPLLATGYDQVPLLAYAACSDINPTMYGVTGNSIPGARAALVAAGVNIVDQATGGLGSTGPNAAQVSAIFGTLVDNNANVSGETVQIAFVSVCMTAASFGANMLGF